MRVECTDEVGWSRKDREGEEKIWYRISGGRRGREDDEDDDDDDAEVVFEEAIAS